MADKQRYKIRYRVEVGDFAKPDDDTLTLVRPGIRVSNDAGYADQLFVASIVEMDGRESILLLSSEGKPSREMLLKVREQINHYLEEHV